MHSPINVLYPYGWHWQHVRPDAEDPKYFIVDIFDVMSSFHSNPYLGVLYDYFPLRDMITCILSVSAFDDTNEIFWVELETRLPEDPKFQLDYDVIALFYEYLYTYLDEFIQFKVGQAAYTSEYVFSKWLSETSLIMQRDDNARACNRSLSPTYDGPRYHQTLATV